VHLAGGAGREKALQFQLIVYIRRGIEIFKNQKKVSKGFIMNECQMISCCAPFVCCKILIFVVFFFIWLAIVVTILTCLITIAKNTKKIAESQKQIAESTKELVGKRG
jgi:hypothetical protein